MNCSDFTSLNPLTAAAAYIRFFHFLSAHFKYVKDKM